MVSVGGMVLSLRRGPSAHRLHREPGVSDLGRGTRWMRAPIAAFAGRRGRGGRTRTELPRARLARARCFAPTPGEAGDAARAPCAHRLPPADAAPRGDDLGRGSRPWLPPRRGRSEPAGPDGARGEALLSRVAASSIVRAAVCSTNPRYALVADGSGCLTVRSVAWRSRCLRGGVAAAKRPRREEWRADPLPRRWLVFAPARRARRRRAPRRAGGPARLPDPLGEVGRRDRMGGCVLR